MLIIFSGLPATGKTSIAKRLAKKIKATYLRIDTIEQAILNAGLNINDVGPAGYFVGYAVAKDNLQFGLTVVADSVNPLNITREAWREVAVSSKVSFIEIELICSDLQEHIQRAESRPNDIPGLQPPSWQKIQDRKYENWEGDHIIIDTANISIDKAVESIMVYLPSSLINL